MVFMCFYIYHMYAYLHIDSCIPRWCCLIVEINNINVLTLNVGGERCETEQNKKLGLVLMQRENVCHDVLKGQAARWRLHRLARHL